MDKLIPDDCMVTYDTDEELIERIRYFHAHPDECKKIAQHGWQLTHQRFGAERVCEWMLSTILSKQVVQSVEWSQFSWQAK